MILDFNQNWSFCKEGGKKTQVNLPHDAMLTEPRNKLCHNGYTEFTVTISDAVKAGENTVSVIVDNSLEPNSRWYSGSGIYRPVSLIIKEKEHIANLQIITKSYEPAVIEVKAEAKDAIVEIIDNHKVIAVGTLGEIELLNAKLWSAEQPYLYTCVVRTRMW